MKEFSHHDHTTCMADAVAALEARCKAHKARLTPIRKRVFELLLEDHRALGAYDILERLGKDGLRPQPPVAYRALEFLVAQGCVYKVERLNAYVACGYDGSKDPATFLICTGCEKVAHTRTADVTHALQSMERDTGFAITTAAVEVEGICAQCQGEAP